MAEVGMRATMDDIIREATTTGKSNLHAAEAELFSAGTDLTNSGQPASLQRVVELINADPENKVSQLETDKFVMQRGYGATSFIYLANGATGHRRH